MPRPEDRIAALKDEVDANPGSRQFYQLGELLRREDRAAEAVDVLQQGLVHHPRYVAAWVALGRAGLSAGTATVAEDALRQALDLDPSNPVAWRLLGEALLDQDHRPAALDAMRMALSLAPGDEVIQAAVESLEEEPGAAEAPAAGGGPFDSGPAESATGGDDVFEDTGARRAARMPAFDADEWDGGEVLASTAAPAHEEAPQAAATPAPDDGGDEVFALDPLPDLADDGPFGVEAPTAFAGSADDAFREEHGGVDTEAAPDSDEPPWQEREIEDVGPAEPGPDGRRWDEVELEPTAETAAEVDAAVQHEEPAPLDAGAGATTEVDVRPYVAAALEPEDEAEPHAEAVPAADRGDEPMAEAAPEPVAEVAAEPMPAEPAAAGPAVDEAIADDADAAAVVQPETGAEQEPLTPEAMPGLSGEMPTMARARTAIQEQRPEEAAEILEQMLALEPDDQEARDLLSLVRDMLEPLPDELPPLAVRERKIAALQRWLAQLTLGRKRAAL